MLDECWLCDSTEIVYTDVIGCHWCEFHLRTYYWGDTEWEPNDSGD